MGGGCCEDYDGSGRVIDLGRFLIHLKMIDAFGWFFKDALT